MSYPPATARALAAGPPRRALAIKFGHIGDVLVTTPVYSALKEAWPGLHLTVLVEEGTEDMVRHNPLVDRVLVLKRRHRDRTAAVRHQWRLIRSLRRGRFDLCLELSNGDRGALLSRLSGSRLRVGFRPKDPHPRTRLFQLTVPVTGVRNHVVDTFLRQIRALGLAPGDTGLKLYPGPQARQRAEEIMAEYGLTPRGFALVHPTSRWMFKCWTPEGNRVLAGELARRGLAVVLTAAPVEKELRFMERVLAGLDIPVVNLAGKLDLLTLAALIRRARVFFGVDSAPMHMAAALGTPTLVVFGPSGERMWGPWRVQCEVVTGDCPTRPCGRDGCQGSKVSRCLVELEPGVVVQALDRLLRRTEV